MILSSALSILTQSSAPVLTSQKLHHQGTPSVRRDRRLPYPKRILSPFNLPSIGRLRPATPQCGLFSSQETKNLNCYSSEKFSKSAADSIKAIEVEQISSGDIKPASPTPPHLKTCKLSFIDQVIPNYYPSIILYYHNDQKTGINDIISERLKNLKQSLSETLTRFYPLAGKVRDDYHIECNDEGVYYVEARVNCSLANFFDRPNFHFIDQLVAVNPNSIKKNYVAMVQVNIFSCGSIAISNSLSHKIGDGHSVNTFAKAWAAAARQSSEIITPTFLAPSLFPSNPSMLSKFPSVSKESLKSGIITKRFIFDASAIANLKKKATADQQIPTAVEAISGLVWKCVAKATWKERSDSQLAVSMLVIPVDLRLKNWRSLKHSLGNITWWACPLCRSDTELELHSMVDMIRKSIDKINSNFVQELKSDQGFLKVDELFQGKFYKNLELSAGNLQVTACTSLCRAGFYQVDFGWGCPTWVSDCNPGFTNIIVLNDTRRGDAIEVLVTLSEEEMATFESASELLEFTSTDWISPLQLQ